MSRPPNCTRIRAGVYVVRTQAGFRKALKEFWNNMGRGDETLEFRGWPRKYPSMIVMNIAYEGYDFIALDIFHLNQLREILETHDATGDRFDATV